MENVDKNKKTTENEITISAPGNNKIVDEEKKNNGSEQISEYNNEKSGEISGGITNKEYSGRESRGSGEKSSGEFSTVISSSSNSAEFNGETTGHIDQQASEFSDNEQSLSNRYFSNQQNSRSIAKDERSSSYESVSSNTEQIGKNINEQSEGTIGQFNERVAGEYKQQPFNSDISPWDSPSINTRVESSIKIVNEPGTDNQFDNDRDQKSITKISDENKKGDVVSTSSSFSTAEVAGSFNDQAISETWVDKEKGVLFRKLIKVNKVVSSSEKLENIDRDNNQKWYHLSANVYENLLKPLDDGTKIFDDFALDFLGKDEIKISDADELVQQIVNSQQYLRSERKRMKIRSRKFFNVVIIIFSIVLIGLCFLKFYFNNRKVIAEFKQKCDEISEKQRNLNAEKIEKLDSIFGNLATLDLFNRFLTNIGMRVMYENLILNVHNLSEDINHNVCKIANLIPFKVGNHIFLNFVVVNEAWRNIRTSGQVVQEYTVTKSNTEGKIVRVNKKEVITAEHIEPTPFRLLESKVFTVFDLNCSANPYCWTLSSINDVKIATGLFRRKVRHHNETANNEFNTHFKIGNIKSNDFYTQTVMNSYLTLYAQETILKIYKYYDCKPVQMRFDTGTFEAISYLYDCSFFTWSPITNYLSYSDFQTNGTMVLTQLKKIFLTITKLLIQLPSYLWAMDNAANNMLNAKKNENLIFGSSYCNTDPAVADFESVINLVNIHGAIKAIEHEDAFPKKSVFKVLNHVNNNGVDCYRCDFLSYYKTDMIDLVPVKSLHCGIVKVPVPYVKFNLFEEGKVFLATTNKTKMLGCYSLRLLNEDKRPELSDAKFLIFCELVCTPQIKVLSVNTELSPSDTEVLVEFIKKVDLTHFAN